MVGYLDMQARKSPVTFIGSLLAGFVAKVLKFVYVLLVHWIIVGVNNFGLFFVNHARFSRRCPHFIFDQKPKIAARMACVAALRRAV